MRSGIRLVLILIGMAATGIAVLGAITPGLPAGPFVLVALYCFGKASPRLYAWFNRLPVLRETLQELRMYRDERTLHKSVKWVAQLAAWSSVAILLLTNAATWLVIVITLAAVGCTVFMVMTPTAQEAE